MILASFLLSLLDLRWIVTNFDFCLLHLDLAFSWLPSATACHISDYLQPKHSVRELVSQALLSACDVILYHNYFLVNSTWL